MDGNGLKIFVESHFPSPVFCFDTDIFFYPLAEPSALLQTPFD
jgi:hypothetical protein